MSVECGECERDLRGGHAADCSRYRLRMCRCGHLWDDHDEEGFCEECSCMNLKVASACLIAAAPELLEALKGFVEDPQFQISIGGNPNAVQKMLDKARAVIAKAEAVHE